MAEVMFSQFPIPGSKGVASSTSSFETLSGTPKPPCKKPNGHEAVMLGGDIQMP